MQKKLSQMAVKQQVVYFICLYVKFVVYEI